MSICVHFYACLSICVHFVSIFPLKCPFVSILELKCPFVSTLKLKCPFVSVLLLKCPFLSISDINVVFRVYMLIRARVKIGFMFRVHFWTSLVFNMLNFCVRIGLNISFMFAALWLAGFGRQRVYKAACSMLQGLSLSTDSEGAASTTITVY